MTAGTGTGTGTALPFDCSPNHPSSSSSSAQLDPSHGSLTLCITISLSASLTLLNKSIYTSFNFPFPLHLLALHFASISITSRLLARTIRSHQLDAYHARVSWSFWFNNIFLVAIAYGSAILCSNLAYLVLSVSFVQMLKAFTPVLLVLATAALDRRLPSARTSLVVLSISSGVAIAAYGELNFVFIGAIWQLLGSLAEVARLIATQRLLQDLRMDPIVALSALSPVCFAMALLLAPILEGSEPLGLLVPRLGLQMLLGSVALAIALNVAVLLLVSSTSALVLTLAGILKDICLILGSIIFFNSSVSTTQVVGYSIAALGLVYFKISGADAEGRQLGKPKGIGYVGVPVEEREMDGLERGGGGGHSESEESSTDSIGGISDVELGEQQVRTTGSSGKRNRKASESINGNETKGGDWAGRFRRKSAGV